MCVLVCVTRTDPPDIQVEKSWIHSGEGFEAKLVCIVYADPVATVCFSFAFRLFECFKCFVIVALYTSSLLYRVVFFCICCCCFLDYYYEIAVWFMQRAAFQVTSSLFSKCFYSISVSAFASVAFAVSVFVFVSFSISISIFFLLFNCFTLAF